MAATNGNPNPGEKPNVLDDIASKAPAGIVLPPRDARNRIEKTAGYVARNGAQFEERIRADPKPTMSFLLPDDPYQGYYRWRLEEIKAGRGNNIAAGREGQQGEVNFTGREERKGPEKPEEFKFSARMPNISAQDLEIVRLTALFVAKNGRSWMTSLSQKEAGNYQFDFLRPQHSLYQFFSRLVDQYKDLLEGDSVDGGQPQKKRVIELEANVKDRFRVLELAKKRAEWVKHQERQKVVEAENEESERIAYAQIDWHDFVVVETVVFDERDENTELPAPTSLNDLESRSLEQKAAWSIDPNRRIEEAMPTFDDHEAFYGQAAPNPPAQQTAAPAVQMPPPQRGYTPRQTPPQAQQSPYQPPRQDEESNRMQSLQADRARARAAQEAAKAGGPMKIRKDYVPAAQAKRQSQNTSICPNCKNAIPNEEMANHLRIEMLDPQWREQSRINQQRSSTTNLSTQDVANNLKRLASQRTDVFDPVTGETISEEERERRKRAEVRAYDGMSGIPPSTEATWAPGQGDKPDVQEQIRLIHERARNG